MNQQLWKTLLHLRQEVAAWTSPPNYCCCSLIDPKMVVDQVLPDAPATLFFIHFTETKIATPQAAHFHWQDDLELKLLTPGEATPSAIAFLQAYLPYCFYSLQARKHKRAITIAHFAQTLDGKIATETGHSKWIGNEENLKHAHRMRALCDAILIGRSTLNHDQPKLNVRHVSGKNPARVVLSGKDADFSCLLEACDAPILVISSKDQPAKESIRHLQLPAANGRLHSDQILTCLYEQGLHTVYIEGGSMTTSNFIKDRAIDILQLHLSPQIFGSGQQSIQLPEIKEVQEAIQFSRFRFQTVGDTQMFVGHLNWQD